MLFDTHTHLDQEEFDDSRDDVVARAMAAGVEQIVAVGTTAEASRQCVAVAEKYGGIYAAVGIQPNYVAEAQPNDWDEIVRLADASNVVAIGETGLDRHWDYAPIELQRDYFNRHMALARERDLPFIVHMRDCDADIIESLRAECAKGPLRGVMHSFTGDADMAAECIELGMHISFAGMVTFKKSQALRDCAASIPNDRLLIETDCPYLSPEPVRGKRPNEPAFVRHTADCLAKARGVTLDSLAATTTRNAQRFFGLSGTSR
ncbi:TatD family hydrolase [Pirellulales bacterium]|nr:TatD family hydrolase [Pirellulales bacterium]